MSDLGVLAIALILYFVPSCIAAMRGHLSLPAITVLNILTGWSGLGWILCLIWSLTGNTRANLLVRR